MCRHWFSVMGMAKYRRLAGKPSACCYIIIDLSTLRGGRCYGTVTDQVPNVPLCGPALSYALSHPASWSPYHVSMYELSSLLF